MSYGKDRIDLALLAAVLLTATVVIITKHSMPVKAESTKSNPVVENPAQKFEQGQQVFRFDSFGDEAFWRDALKLHQAIEGQSSEESTQV